MCVTCGLNTHTHTRYEQIVNHENIGISSGNDWNWLLVQSTIIVIITAILIAKHQGNQIGENITHSLTHPMRWWLSLRSFDHHSPQCQAEQHRHDFVLLLVVELTPPQSHSRCTCKKNQASHLLEKKYFEEEYWGLGVSPISYLGKRTAG